MSFYMRDGNNRLSDHRPSTRKEANMLTAIKLSPRIINPNDLKPIDVVIELTAPAPRNLERAPIDAAIVIDRSGSMAGQSLEQVKAAVAALFRQLGPDDRIAVITFDSNVDVVLPLDRHDPAIASSAISGIRSGGSTNLSGGWLEGLRLLTTDPRPGAVRRIITLTDGHANNGITTVEELAPIVGGARSQGVTSSFIGFEAGYDERFLAGLADAGGGDDYWCDGPDKAAEVFNHEFGGLARVVAQNLRVAVAPTALTTHTGLLQDLPATDSLDGGFTLALGDSFGDEVRRVVLRLHPADGLATGQAVFANVTIDWAALGAEPGLHTVTVPVIIQVNPEANTDDGDNVDPEVVAQVLALDAARLQREAAEAAERGDWEIASQHFRTSADLLEESRSDATEVNRLRRAALRAESRQWDQRSSKEEYSLSRQRNKSRKTSFSDETRDDDGGA